MSITYLIFPTVYAIKLLKWKTN